jgi:hypothetical protein
MTAASIDTPVQQQPVSAQTAQSWEHADQVAALAGTAAASLTGRAHELLKTLLALALARFAVKGATGSIRALIEFREWFATEVDRIGAALPDPARVLSQLEDALRLGARQAVVESGADPLGRHELTLDARMLGQLAATRDRQRALLADANTLISVARERGDVLKAFALASRAVTYTDQGAANLVHDAVRSGMDQVALAGSWQQIAIGERNCCLRCASFQGAIAEPPDYVFQPVLPGRWLTAADRLGATIPFHPHCRDRGRLVRADQSRVSSLMDPGSLTNVLRREARRSIVLGLALPSESQSARQRAASELLARRGGAGLPKSVEQRARRTIASGRFRTRAVITTR